VPRGPAVASALAALRDARLDGLVVDRATEMDYVRAWHSSQERKA
jgi:pantothenate kinase-related protein Tda10